MTPQELKNSILQWVVQGKLVPQDHNDEPAKILLEKIQKEKAELIKQKKIKAGTISTIFRGEDNLFYERIGDEIQCIDAEIPFDIPDSWEWVRLGNICIINPRNTSDDNIEAGFMPMPLLKEGYNDAHQFTIKKWKEIKSGYTHFANNDIVVAKITPCFQNRKSAIIANLPNNIGAGTTELHVIRALHETVILKYILWFVKTAYFIDNGVKAFTGTAGQQRVGADYISNALFPLPPLAEQKRIVEKIESLMPIIDEYGTAYTAFQNLENAFPDNLKKSLLQWAVQGKLVPQDLTDEPAKILLEKIKAEKAELIKQKKIKADKNTSTIFRGEDNLFYETIGKTTTCIQDEIPFDIPDSWEWVRLGDIVYLINGVSYQKQDISKQGLRILRGGNIQDNKIFLLDDDIFLPISYFNEEKIIQEGDTVIVASTGSKTVIGKPAYALKNYPNTMIGAFLRICRPINNELKIYNYLKIFFESEYYRNNIRILVKGTNINNIKESNITQMLFPLPPLEEQKRITQKLESLMPLCAELENKKNNFYNT